MGAHGTGGVGTRSWRGLRAVRWAATTAAILIVILVSSYDPRALLLVVGAAALTLVARIPARVVVGIVVLAVLGIAALVALPVRHQGAPPPLRVAVPVLHEVEATYERPNWRIIEIVSMKSGGLDQLVTIDSDLPPPSGDVVEAAVAEGMVRFDWESGVQVGDRLVFRRERLEPATLRRFTLRTTHTLQVWPPRLPLGDADARWQLTLLPDADSHMSVTAPERMVLATTPASQSRAQLAGGLEQVVVPLEVTVTDWLLSPGASEAVRLDTVRGIIRFTPVGQLLARMEATGWWLLPVTVATALIVPAWQLVRSDLLKASIARLRRTIRAVSPAR